MTKGVFYENKACEFLKLGGYAIIKRNFSCRWGEIDIIAKDNQCICFVEVKARAKNYQVSAGEAVNFSKRKKIRKTALFYSQDNLNQLYRFDLLEIICGDNWRQYNLIKNAFDLNENLS
jgi:putative endonuclease